jgi:hypothetical protein
MLTDPKIIKDLEDGKHCLCDVKTTSITYEGDDTVYVRFEPCGCRFESNDYRFRKFGVGPDQI